MRLLDTRLELVDLGGELLVHLPHGEHAAVRLAHRARVPGLDELDEVAVRDEQTRVALQVPREHRTVRGRESRPSVVAVHGREPRIQLGTREDVVQRAGRALRECVADEISGALRQCITYLDVVQEHPLAAHLAPHVLVANRVAVLEPVRGRAPCRPRDPVP